MKKILILGVVVLLGAGLAYVVINQNTAMVEPEATDDSDPTSETLTPYTSEEMGVSFSYQSGPSGYTLIEPENMGNESEDFVGGVVLMRTPDYEDMQSGPDRGGPPTITVSAFDAPDTELTDWLSANTNFTNYQSGQAEPVTVGDVAGVRYGWEGMFNGETAAVLYRGRVYLFDGTYSEPSDNRLADFRNILETVSFATPSRMTLSGTYVCLGEDAVINPPSETCPRGLLTAEGETYALDLMLMSQTPPPLETGDEITVSGVFNPKERLSASQWADLEVEGILSATSLTKVGE